MSEQCKQFVRKQIDSLDANMIRKWSKKTLLPEGIIGTRNWLAT